MFFTTISPHLDLYSFQINTNDLYDKIQGQVKKLET